MLLIVHNVAKVFAKSIDNLIPMTCFQVVAINVSHMEFFIYFHLTIELVEFLGVMGAMMLYNKHNVF